MFRKAVNNARFALLGMLKSAEKSLSDDALFTNKNILNTARYYIPFVPSPCREFNINDYEKRLSERLKSTRRSYSDEEKKEIIDNVAIIRRRNLPLYRVKDINGVPDYSPDKHILFGTITRGVIMSIFMLINPPFVIEPLAGIITLSGLAAYITFKRMLISEWDDDNMIVDRLRAIDNILAGNSVSNIKIDIAKSLNIGMNENAEIKSLHPANDNDSIVMMFPKNTYDNGKE